MNATSSAPPPGPMGGPWSPEPRGLGPTSLGEGPPRVPHPHPHHMRGPRPFFIREIYKNGFLKRLPHNERKSSALSKLLKSDRYWVVFSVHDDILPFLELWNEPTEVANKPPQLMFPLAVCQHVTQSIVPNADNEWSFVINFETVAIRFSCGSRQIMIEWVECMKMKLGEMGILNPKGNLYSKVPPQKPPQPPQPTGRNPMSPLPTPPLATEENGQQREDQARTRTSIVDASDQANQSFTTSIYLNQTPPTQRPQEPENDPKGKKKRLIPTKSYEQVKSEDNVEVKNEEKENLVLKVTSANQSTGTNASPATTTAKTSIYLNKDSNPARHVTVIPINREENPSQDTPKREEIKEESYYDAIFEFEDSKTAKMGSPNKTPLSKHNSTNTILRGEKKRQQSPPSLRQLEPLPPPPPPSHEPGIEIKERREKERRRRASREDLAGGQRKSSAVSRRCSEKKNTTPSSHSMATGAVACPKTKKRGQRSSSLGPLLDDTPLHTKTKDTKPEVFGSNMLRHQSRATNTNSLESIESNPRQAVAKWDFKRGERGDPQAAVRAMRAVVNQGHPRRPPLPVPTDSSDTLSTSPSTQQHVGSPSRNIDHPLPPGIRPPPCHSLASLQNSNPSGPHTPHPPHLPLPGLTCQLSFHPSSMPPPVPEQGGGGQNQRSTLREQQVVRLRQEIMHPSGVRLTLRKRDCQNSLALVEFFGCLWVAGWKQRDFPVLYNAFQVGDQILSVAGMPVKTSHEFNKLVKQKSPSSQGTQGATSGTAGSSSGNTSMLTNWETLPHVEIIVRRLPFAQVFYLKREIEGQPLGILLNNSTAEIKEIVPGSPASLIGMTSKIRSFNDSSALVPWCITAINGRPLNLFAKEGETMERLGAIGRDISVTLQPADIVAKIRKNLKSVKNYREYLLN